MGLNPIPGFSHQYDVLEAYLNANDLTESDLGDGWRVICDFNSCGPISLTASMLFILGAITPDAAEVLMALGSGYDPPDGWCSRIVGAGDLDPGTMDLTDLANSFGDIGIAAFREHPFHDNPLYKLPLKQEDVFAVFCNRLSQGVWPIVLQGMKVDGRTREPFLRYSGDNGHFIVISGLSVGSLWSRGPKWQWVRIYDPFYNHVEYLKAEDLHNNRAQSGVVYVGSTSSIQQIINAEKQGKLESELP